MRTTSSPPVTSTEARFLVYYGGVFIAILVGLFTRPVLNLDVAAAGQWAADMGTAGSMAVMKTAVMGEKLPLGVLFSPANIDTPFRNLIAMHVAAYTFAGLILSGLLLAGLIKARKV